MNPITTINTKGITMDHTYIIGFVLVALAVVLAFVNYAVTRNDAKTEQRKIDQAKKAADALRIQNRQWTWLEKF